MRKCDYDHLKKYYPLSEQDKVVWAFVCFSRQNYEHIVPLMAEDEIIIGLENGDGGVVCKMPIRWYLLRGETASPRIECFDEAWPMFLAPTFTKFLRRLAALQDQAPTPDDISRVLISCGFCDQSDRPLDGSPKGGGGT